MFSRRTRWSQHFQRMGTRYTSRCRGANNLDQFAWLMGDSPYYKFAPPPVRPHYRERTTSNGAKLPDSVCSEENDYLSLGLQCFAIEYESYSLFFFSLVFLRACTRRYMHNLGSAFKRISPQTNCYL